MKPRSRNWAGGLAAGLLLAACTSSSAAPFRPASLGFQCPSKAKLGVYQPHRLNTIRECVWYVGTVADEGPRSDGDTHLLVAPAPGYERFLNATNSKDGGLVVEIMPGQHLPAPAIGSQIAVFGTWVLDQHNDWNEIHPVWGIDYLDQHTDAYSLPPATPEYTGKDDS